MNFPERFSSKGNSRYNRLFLRVDLRFQFIQFFLALL